MELRVNGCRVVLVACVAVACGGAGQLPGEPIPDAGDGVDTQAPDSSVPGEDDARVHDAPPPRDVPPDLPSRDTGTPRRDVSAPGTDARGDTDPGRDAGFDAGFDAGRDAGFDAGSDRGGPGDGPRDAAMDAGTDLGPGVDGGPFSDAGSVMPSRRRVGPQASARVVFTSNEQKGAFWELPGGDVLTSFQTARTPIRPGVAVYDLRYSLRRVSGGMVVRSPDSPSGSCRDDGTLRGCDVGPDAAGPSERSGVADDGTILVLQRRAMADGRSYPVLLRLDPATGLLGTVAEFTDLRSGRADSAYDPPMALRFLASGQVAVTAHMIDAAPQTRIVQADGVVRARSDGYAFGDRWSPFALLLGESAFAAGNRFRWWDARTGATVFFHALPSLTPGASSPLYRTFVSPAGNVVFPGATYTSRLLHVAADGRVVEDRDFVPAGFLGVYSDGAYLTYERTGAGELDYATRARTATGSVALYDDATLARDAGWSPNPRGGFRYPYLLGARRAVIDDAGNAYVGFVLQTGGDSRTETFLAGFARDGRRLWGLRLPTAYGGECLPRAVLTGRRVAVVCPGRFVNRFILVGE